MAQIQFYQHSKNNQMEKQIYYNAEEIFDTLNEMITGFEDLQVPIFVFKDGEKYRITEVDIIRNADESVHSIDLNI